MMQASHRQFVAFSRFAIARRGIHATRPCLIKVGDRVPGTCGLVFTMLHSYMLIRYIITHACITVELQVERLTSIDVKLMEGSPGNQVSIAQELSRVDRGLIIGVPAAYSPGCSESHIPGYLNHKGLAAAGPTFVVAVNDAFVYDLAVTIVV